MQTVEVPGGRRTGGRQRAVGVLALHQRGAQLYRVAGDVGRTAACHSAGVDGVLVVQLVERRRRRQLVVMQRLMVAAVERVHRGSNKTPTTMPDASQ